MAVAEDEWGGDLTRFLDRPPSRPCLVPPAPSLCSVCGKLHNPDASVCRYYPLRHERARGETRIGSSGSPAEDFEVVPGEDEFPDAPLIEYERPRRPAGVITAATGKPAPRPAVRKIPPAAGRARPPAAPVKKAVRAPKPEVVEAELVEVVEEALKKPEKEAAAKGAALEGRERPAEKEEPVATDAGGERKKAETAEQRAALEEAERLERELLAAGKIRPVEEAPAPAPKETRIPTVAPIYKEPILKILSAEPPKPPGGAPPATGAAAPPKEAPLPPPPPGFPAVAPAPAAKPAAPAPAAPAAAHAAPPTGTTPPAAPPVQPQAHPPAAPPGPPQAPPPAGPPAGPAPPSPAPAPVPAAGRRTGGLYDILRKRGAEEKKEAPAPPPAPPESAGAGKTEKNDELLKRLKEISR